MKRFAFALIASGSAALCSVCATAQTTLYGVRAEGELLRIDPATGAATPFANCGQSLETASGSSPYSQLETLFYAQPVTLPAGYRIRAMASIGAYRTALLLVSDEPGIPSLLARSETGSQIAPIIGPTGRTDLIGLAAFSESSVYALGTEAGGALCRVDSTTGAATLIGHGAYAGADCLAVLDGRLLACGSTLMEINVISGAATPIGATGYSDVRGIAVISRRECYPNCDPGGIPPLNVLDFNCFLNAFAFGAPYANCDESTTPPVLNVLDFNCFLNRFSAGCSAP
jgi:hypothetical protein